MELVAEPALKQFATLSELDEGLDLWSVGVDSWEHFCYLFSMVGAECVPKEYIPQALELAIQQACKNSADHKAILCVSVQTDERFYQDWIALATDYPGATITSIERWYDDDPDDRRTIYTLMFPYIPQI